MPVDGKEWIILIHGFHRSYMDMTPLRNLLISKGYKVSRINLPLTFSTIEEATSALIEIADKKIPKLKNGQKIHLVGHSTGGLIIRHFLAVSDFLPYVGRCVLIATPNHGYKLASYAEKLSKTYISIYKTMKSLQPEQVNLLKLIGNEVEIGAIAGTKSSPLLSGLIGGINDGRIDVNAVKYDELTDFITLPYKHTQIHKKEETAELIDTFIKTGKFLTDL
ncbi:MAG: alpha/beta hydrolase [Firmicutes bacterium HGW-Firmicutes-1]|nr:MAG: alpha/beta hydrolase [Firmicutes bacterium HGW-Firmicutes-1]